MDEKLREKITKVTESAGFETTLISTISPVNVHADERNETLRSKWEEFGQCSLIITDRLHGMIFSAVTGTNCIAFDNISHKVCGGYEWLEKLDYVKYCDNYNDFENAFQGFSFDEKNEYRRELVIGNHFARITEFIESLER